MQGLLCAAADAIHCSEAHTRRAKTVTDRTLSHFYLIFGVQKAPVRLLPRIRTSFRSGESDSGSSHRAPSSIGPAALDRIKLDLSRLNPEVKGHSASPDTAEGFAPQLKRHVVAQPSGPRHALALCGPWLCGRRSKSAHFARNVGQALQRSVTALSRGKWASVQ